MKCLLNHMPFLRRIVAYGLVAAMAVGLLVSGTSYAVDSLSHIEAIKASGSTFVILEIVPEAGSGSMGYYIDGQEPASAWRDRLAAIDEVAGLFDPAMVQEAKYGKTACTAAELAYRAATEAAKKGRKFLSDLDDDADDSGTAKIGTAPSGDPNAAKKKDVKDMTPEERLAEARAQVKTIFHGKDGK